ncbi:hypothetical protein POM88_034716 [Heracleum sosnowskyi]|uniref:Uncharacterized protein n=1 Tax=Heracleum sosnowskyi TaxID=360622 RepID=A0AAD8HLP5_9APIA|nr:hypothetical protein POM88_034716 [Heracleum sosnowskyi]
MQFKLSLTLSMGDQGYVSLEHTRPSVLCTNSFRNPILLKFDLNANITQEEAKLLIKKNGDALSHLQVLQHAFVYLAMVKGPVDLILSIYESKHFFLATSCKDAFWLVEVELNCLKTQNSLCCFLNSITPLELYPTSQLLHFGALPLNRKDHLNFAYGSNSIGRDCIFYATFCDWIVLKLRPLVLFVNL